MNHRPSWDQVHMQVARLVSKRATCERAKVGAVIAKDNRIIATGYNGAPSGQDHCTEVGCLIIKGHCRRCVHAETNALMTAARYGIATEHTTVYCTMLPCLTCLLNLKQAGVHRIIYAEEYPHAESAHVHELGAGLLRLLPSDGILFM